MSFVFLNKQNNQDVDDIGPTEERHVASIFSLSGGFANHVGRESIGAEIQWVLFFF